MKKTNEQERIELLESKLNLANSSILILRNQIQNIQDEIRESKKPIAILNHKRNKDNNINVYDLFIGFVLAMLVVSFIVLFAIVINNCKA